METNIFVEPTDEQKRSMKMLRVDGNEPTVKDIATQRILEKERTFLQELRKPYCARCAKFDVQDFLEKNTKEAERLAGFANFDKLVTQLPDLEAYGNPDRFIFVKETDAMEPANRIEPGKVTRQIKIGVNRSYRCKIRNCGISLQFLNEEITKDKK